VQEAVPREVGYGKNHVRVSESESRVLKGRHAKGDWGVHYPSVKDKRKDKCKRGLYNEKDEFGESIEVKQTRKYCSSGINRVSSYSFLPKASDGPATVVLRGKRHMKRNTF